ncbi:acyl-[acyl-carrier-protein] thioesterase [Lewinella sp. W8]|uniref:acyl-[acyl-carrier-protein] thioesterase n=1 Tax=Lewinella sp. W8 TaxID=2528208 RepID=UPI0015631DF4|nr:acyl-ACP thioesterase domain-containing protein [Lewinella sp. W8]
MLEQSPLHELLDFRVAAAAVGPHQHLTPPHLIRMLQEAAMRNTVRLNISSPELMEAYGLSWVLRRQNIDCQRWPRLGERIRVLTAPTGFAGKLQTFRDFHLLDEAGNRIISATTAWLIMDVANRRLKPIPERVAALKKDLAPASAHLPRPLEKVPPPSSVDATIDSRVAFYQLDFNDHLTNPVFPELMLEPLGHDYLLGHLPTRIMIAYHREARYGEKVRAGVQTDTATHHHQHVLLRGEEVLATMDTRWQPLE